MSFQPNKVAKGKPHANSSSMACVYCRSKKIKCEFTPNGCQKCRKLNIDCVWQSEDQRRIPSSKAHIKHLQNRIEQLEAALAAATDAHVSITHTADQYPPSHRRAAFPTPPAPSTPISTEETQNSFVSRLCHRQWQLNSDAEGQLKFFGPTSSLHLTENVSMSILGSWEEASINDDAFTINDIDKDTQIHLLDLYWKYQHTVLQIFHKKTFLRSLETKQPKYVSKALLYCIFACAARISPRPAVRSMVLPVVDDDMDDSQPYLITTVKKHLEEELKRPRVTTIQSLLLFSLIYCAIGQDTKGWLLTGDACMLAIDLGIHKNITSDKISSPLSLEEQRARQMAFWGCITFDRFWAMYLGRPSCFKAEGLSPDNIYRLEDEDPWETSMSYAWVTLVKIVGDICESLNSDNCTIERLEDLDGQLRTWHNSLDDYMKYQPNCAASISILHMQYAAGVILLHQPNAKFGNRLADLDERNIFAQKHCIHYATEIARYLQDFRHSHGDASLLMGVALHCIATAATTLVAAIGGRNSLDRSLEMYSLKICVRSLGEMEKTYLVARRVRKITQLIIRVCHLEKEYHSSNEQLTHAIIDLSAEKPNPMVAHANENSFLSEESMVVEDAFAEAAKSGYSPLGFDEFLPISAQLDIFHTFDTEIATGRKDLQGNFR